MATSNNNDYPCIRAWERMFGAGQYYINQQLQKARETNAPADAIYYREEGGWHRLCDVTSGDTRWYFKQNHPELVERFCKNWQ